MSDTIPRKNRIGRPPKKKLPRGRPKGEATIMREYKQRMLNSPQSRKVLQAIFDAALNDDHKHQAAAWKLVMDRIAPIGMFEEEVMKNPTKNSIQINITGLSAAQVVEEDPIDVEDYTKED